MGTLILRMISLNTAATISILDTLRAFTSSSTSTTQGGLESAKSDWRIFVQRYRSHQIFAEEKTIVKLFYVMKIVQDVFKKLLLLRKIP
jgi:hypothetical protein